MHFFRSIRVLVAAGCVVAWLGVAYTAEKSASSMADAATKFLSSLTPEQRQKAAFAFDGDERLKWHFIPTEMFPRNGLTVGDDDRGAAEARPCPPAVRAQPARLHDRDRDHGSRDDPERDRKRRPAGGSRGTRRQRAGARPGPLLLFSLRDAVGARRVGLARGRPPRLVELHGRQRQLRRRVAVVLRDQPGRGPRWSEEGHPDSGDAGRLRAGAPDGARRGPAQAGGDRRRRAERHLDDERGRHQAAGAGRHRRRPV